MAKNSKTPQAEMNTVEAELLEKELNQKDVEEEISQLRAEIQAYYLEHPEHDPTLPDRIFVKDMSELEEKITEHIPKKIVEDEIIIKNIIEQESVANGELNGPLDFSRAREYELPEDYRNELFLPNEKIVDEEQEEKVRKPQREGIDEDVEEQEEKKQNLFAKKEINQGEQGDMGSVDGDEPREELGISTEEGNTSVDYDLIRESFGDEIFAKGEAQEETFVNQIYAGSKSEGSTRKKKEETKQDGSSAIKEEERKKSDYSDKDKQDIQDILQELFHKGKLEAEVHSEDKGAYGADAQEIPDEDGIEGQDVEESIEEESIKPRSEAEGENEKGDQGEGLEELIKNTIESGEFRDSSEVSDKEEVERKQDKDGMVNKIFVSTKQKKKEDEKGKDSEKEKKSNQYPQSIKQVKERLEIQRHEREEEEEIEIPIEVKVPVWKKTVEKGKMQEDPKQSNRTEENEKNIPQDKNIEPEEVKEAFKEKEQPKANNNQKEQASQSIGKKDEQESSGLKPKEKEIPLKEEAKQNEVKSEPIMVKVTTPQKPLVVKEKIREPIVVKEEIPAEPTVIREEIENFSETVVMKEDTPPINTTTKKEDEKRQENNNNKQTEHGKASALFGRERIVSLDESTKLTEQSTIKEETTIVEKEVEVPLKVPAKAAEIDITGLELNKGEKPKPVGKAEGEKLMPTLGKSKPIDLSGLGVKKEKGAEVKKTLLKPEEENHVAKTRDTQPGSKEIDLSGLNKGSKQSEFSKEEAREKRIIEEKVEIPVKVPAKTAEIDVTGLNLNKGEKAKPVGKAIEKELTLPKENEKTLEAPEIAFFDNQNENKEKGISDVLASLNDLEANLKKKDDSNEKTQEFASVKADGSPKAEETAVTLVENGDNPVQETLVNESEDGAIKGIEMPLVEEKPTDAMEELLKSLDVQGEKNQNSPIISANIDRQEVNSEKDKNSGKNKSKKSRKQKKADLKREEIGQPAVEVKYAPEKSAQSIQMGKNDKKADHITVYKPEKKESFFSRLLKKLRALFSPTKKEKKKDVTIMENEQVTDVMIQDLEGKKLEIHGIINGCIQGESIIVNPDAVIKKDVEVTGHVLCMQNSTIMGNVKCEEIVVDGIIRGDVYASKQVIIRNNGLVAGSIYCANVQVEQQGVIQGNIHH